jgi:hypothetical protein
MGQKTLSTYIRGEHAAFDPAGRSCRETPTVVSGFLYTLFRADSGGGEGEVPDEV